MNPPSLPSNDAAKQEALLQQQAEIDALKRELEEYEKKQRQLSQKRQSMVFELEKIRLAPSDAAVEDGGYSQWMSELLKPFDFDNSFSLPEPSNNTADLTSQ
jgi:hypothetical protein